MPTLNSHTGIRCSASVWSRRKRSAAGMSARVVYRAADNDGVVAVRFRRVVEVADVGNQAVRAYARRDELGDRLGRAAGTGVGDQDPVDVMSHAALSNMDI